MTDKGEIRISVNQASERRVKEIEIRSEAVRLQNQLIANILSCVEVGNGELAAQYLRQLLKLQIFGTRKESARRKGEDEKEIPSLLKIPSLLNESNKRLLLKLVRIINEGVELMQPDYIQFSQHLEENKLLKYLLVTLAKKIRYSGNMLSLLKGVLNQEGWFLDKMSRNNLKYKSKKSKR